MVVILVVLTGWELRVSLPFSQLQAKAIPVRGAIFRKSRLRKLKRDFCFYHFIQYVHVKSVPDTHFILLQHWEKVVV
ncbi:hypothetical protein EG333_06765 [Pectobacterium versatile]|nr:hypothetical protein EG333_06765 [Pectobacterium versatile]